MNTLNKFLFVFINLILLNFTLFGQNNNNMNDQNETFEKEWKEIDQLKRKGLPKSALELVNIIYDKAKAAKNEPQQLKAFIQKEQLASESIENTIDSIYIHYLNEIKIVSNPSASILKSILAETLHNYLQQNIWKFQNRTALSDTDANQDIQSWDISRFNREIQKLYLSSVYDLTDKALPIDTYKSIIHNEDKKYLQQLYEFLLYRATLALKSPNQYITEPVYKFTINLPEYFASNQEFANLKFNSLDSSSNMYLTMKLFQDGTKYNLSSKNGLALIDLDLRRLEFVYQNSTLANKKELYLNALNSIIEQNPNHSEILRAYYLKANLYYEEGSRYDKQNKTGNKNGYVEAMKVIDEVLKKHDKNVNDFINLKNQITLVTFDHQLEAINLPDKPILMKCNLRNSDKLFVKIIPISTSRYKSYYSEQNYEQKQNKLNGFIEKSSNASISYTLKSFDDYQTHETELAINPLKSGNYIVAISDKPEFKKGSYYNAKLIQVSKIAWFYKDVAGYNKEFHLVDRASGEPLKNVKATIYEWNYQNRSSIFEKSKVIISDKNSKLLVPQNKNNNYLVEFTNGKDTLFTENNYYNYYYPQQEFTSQTTLLFSDRSIYRPGQIVYFKGIYYVNGKNPKILPNQKVNIILRDVNQQEVSELELVTNEYGSFNGSFVLPNSGLSGSFSLESVGNSIPIQVEEYKRPTFEVKLDPISGSYKLGDMISLKGKTIGYSGGALNDAIVKYRVTRKKDYPFYGYWRRGWFPNRNSDQVEIDNGTIQTNQDGSFEIKFIAKSDDLIDNDNPRFQFSVSTDVTDITGETRSTTASIFICDIPFLIQNNIPERMDRNAKAKLNITTVNHNDQLVNTNLNIKIYSLIEPKNDFVKRYWEEPEYQLLSKEAFHKSFPQYSYEQEDLPINWAKDNLVFEKTIASNELEKFDFDIKKWNTGVYIIEIIAKDENGKEAESKGTFSVYDIQSQSFPKIGTLDILNDKENYDPLDVCNQFLVSRETIHVFYEVEQFNKTKSQNWKKVNGIEQLKYTITDGDKGNFHCIATFVKNNRFYQIVKEVEVPWKDKDLSIEYETFRDKLLPGEDEVWKIKIKGYKKDKVMAELLATMYDASLDQFLPHDYQKPNFFPISSVSNLFQQNSFEIANQLPIRQIGERFKYLKTQLTIKYPYYIYSNNFNFYSDAPMLRMKSMSMNAVRAGGILDEGVAADSFSAKKKDTDDLKEAKAEALVFEKEKNSSPVELQPRTNLKETVFFYPNLETDSSGNVIIKFKMNDALTKWKFLAFAHDKNLATAVSSKTLITQKDLMILPFAPRFFREGDTITFTGKVTNLSQTALNGIAKLEFFDAITGANMNAKLSNQMIDKQFNIQPSLSEKVEWKLIIPNEIINTLKFRISAVSGNFTDAEENVVPVVSNRMLVTESLPLPVGPNQTKSFTLKSMAENNSNSLTNHKFTFEFTPNPVWYAVKALPYLMEFPHECSEQLFNRFYANTLANHIANSTPKIKTIFDQWRNNPDALKSNLELNQDLKSAILEETPWILDAQNEATQRKNIALLFDLNKMAFEKEKAMIKLKERINGDGGISWFPGNRSSVYITQYILEGIGHLIKLNVLKEEEFDWLQQSINYVDNEFAKRYEDLKRMAKVGNIKMEDDHLDYLSIHYLYLKSFYNSNNEEANVTEAKKYYLGQAKKYWQKGIYMEGMIALILKRNKENSTASDILKSLKERSIVNEELGMYWKMNYGYYWYQLPIETQSLLIEAFTEISKDNQSVELMKTWLLKNKQTNNWSTTKGTANAIYALLLNGNDWLNADKEPIITLGKKVVETSTLEKEAGSGYFKFEIKDKEITKDLANIKLENRNPVPSWGAIYWQYFEQLDKIKTFKETPLTLAKQYFIEENSSSGPKLIEINDNKILKPGDKLKVRIVLKVDREMEFVHLKDMRPANTEPINVISQYKWQDGLGYYESTKDLSSNFFMDYLPKGTFVFEYPINIVREGNCSTGIATIQCMYAPEFSSHSNGLKLKVGKQ